MDFDTLGYFIYMEETETAATNENRSTEKKDHFGEDLTTTKEKELEQ